MTKKWYIPLGFAATLSLAGALACAAQSEGQISEGVQQDEKEHQEDYKEQQFWQKLNALNEELILKILAYAEPSSICDTPVDRLVPRIVCDKANLMAVDAGGKHLVTKHSDRLCLWDIAACSLLDTIKHGDCVFGLQVASNKPFVFVTTSSYSHDEDEGTVLERKMQIWDIRARALRHNMTGFRMTTNNENGGTRNAEVDPMNKLESSISSDNRFLILACKTGIVIQNMRTELPERRFKMNGDEKMLLFAGRGVLTRNKGRVYVWQPRSPLESYKKQVLTRLQGRRLLCGKIAQG